MRERPAINFKEVPLFVKVGLIIAFFALPLYLFIPLGIVGIYYAFWLSVKKDVDGTHPQEQENDMGILVQDVKRAIKTDNKGADNDISYEDIERRMKTKEATATSCPQCGSKFYNGKPQVCQLSNCYYDQ